MRQCEIERCAFIDLALGPGPPPMAVNDPSYCRKTNSCAFEIFTAVEPLEDTEQLVHILHVETNTIVPDVKRRFAIARYRSDFDLGAIARGRVLH